MASPAATPPEKEKATPAIVESNLSLSLSLSMFSHIYINTHIYSATDILTVKFDFHNGLYHLFQS